MFAKVAIGAVIVIVIVAIYYYVRRRAKTVATAQPLSSAVIASPLVIQSVAASDVSRAGERFCCCTCTRDR
jgi:hypothetical protein